MLMMFPVSRQGTRIKHAYEEPSRIGSAVAIARSMTCAIPPPRFTFMPLVVSLSATTPQMLITCFVQP